MTPGAARGMRAATPWGGLVLVLVLVFLLVVLDLGRDLQLPAAGQDARSAGIVVVDEEPPVTVWPSAFERGQRHVRVRRRSRPGEWIVSGVHLKRAGLIGRSKRAGAQLRKVREV